MDKYIFLLALEDALSGLPEKDRQASIEYYNEIISDRTDDGMSEAEAVAALGSVDDIAKQILLDQPLSKLVKAKAKPRQKMRFWEILLMCLGFPVWFPVLVAVFAVILAIYIVLWAVVLVFYVVDICFAACGLGGVLGGLVLCLTGRLSQGLLLMGAGLVCGGLALLLLPVCKLITKGIFWLCKLLLRGIKSCFIRKGDKK